MKIDPKYIQDELWDNIKAHEIGLGNAEYGFQNRLAYENNWSHEFTLEAIEEYKRFMYLLCRCEHPVTPSRDVDQVWHLHLLYTKDYWLEFVPKLSKTPHHNPTKGGKNEGEKFIEYYENTLRSYRKIFQEEAPAGIWPDSSIRFNSDRRIKLVDPKNFVLLRKSELKWFLCLILVYLIYLILR